jgi:hypothetical protein
VEEGRGEDAVNWAIVLLTLAALGTGSLIAGGALIVSATAAHIGRSRCRNPAEAFLSGGDGCADVFTEDDLYGLRGISWTLWGIVGALTGVVLAYLLLGEHNAALALIGLVGAFAPSLVRAYLIRRHRARISRHVRAFISLLRRALSLGNGLRSALQDAVGLLELGVVRERLRHHLGRPFVVDPVDVVKDLAKDIPSAELDSLVMGIVAARKARSGWGENVLPGPWATTGCYGGRTLVVELLLAEPRLPARYPCLVLRGPDRHNLLAHQLALPLIQAEASALAVSVGASPDPWITFPATGEAF